eukprot:403372364
MTNDSYLFKLGYSTYFTNQFSQIRPNHGKTDLRNMIDKIREIKCICSNLITHCPVQRIGNLNFHERLLLSNKLIYQMISKKLIKEPSYTRQSNTYKLIESKSKIQSQSRPPNGIYINLITLFVQVTMGVSNRVTLMTSLHSALQQTGDVRVSQKHPICLANSLLLQIISDSYLDTHSSQNKYKPISPKVPVNNREAYSLMLQCLPLYFDSIPILLESPLQHLSIFAKRQGEIIKPLTHLQVSTIHFPCSPPHSYILF